MRTKGFCGLVALVFAVAIGYFLHTYFYGLTVAVSEPRLPMAEYPAVLEVGVQEIGDVAVAHFEICNRGTAPLFIDKIKTTCSCTGIERELNGSYAKIESLQVGVGQTIPLVMRIRVQGSSPGESLAIGVGFDTNDPTKPNGIIKAVITHTNGGITATPKAVVIGPVRVGQETTRYVDVFDGAVPPRSISYLACSDPSRISATFLPIAIDKLEAKIDVRGVLIGKIEVKVDTRIAGNLNEFVKVHLVGREERPDTLSVQGSIVPLVYFLPSRLILPIASANGPLFTGRFVCRNATDKQMALTLDSIPYGLDARICAGDDKSQPGIIEVTWNPDTGAALADGLEHIIVLRAVVDSQETQLVLPVICTNRGKR